MAEYPTLRQHIREVVASSSISDPHDLASKIIESSTAAERKAWLAEALPTLCAEVMRTERNEAIASRPARRMPAKSAKVAGVRDWWSRFLAARIPVDGKWKTVGDLTGPELQVVIEERRQQAAAIDAQADKYERLLKILAAHSALRVRDLPAAAVAEFEAVAA